MSFLLQNAATLGHKVSRALDVLHYFGLAYLKFCGIVFDRLEEIDSVKEVEKFVIEEVETETIKEVEKVVTRQPRIINVEYLLFNYNPEINQHREELFKLKLKMFEEDIVKNSKAKIKKTAIRKATTPAEAISAYNAFMK